MNQPISQTSQPPVPAPPSPPSPPRIDSRESFGVALRWGFDRAFANGARCIICSDPNFEAWPLNDAAPGGEARRLTRHGVVARGQQHQAALRQAQPSGQLLQQRWVVQRPSLEIWVAADDATRAVGKGPVESPAQRRAEGFA